MQLRTQINTQLYQVGKLFHIFTHFMFNNFFFPENRAVYEITWRNIVQPSRTQMTTWRTRIACWITKATNTHTGCVILIAFGLLKRLHERASMLRHTYEYIACLVLHQQLRDAHCASLPTAKQTQLFWSYPFHHNSLYNMQHSIQSNHDTCLLICRSKVDCKHGMPEGRQY